MDQIKRKFLFVCFANDEGHRRHCDSYYATQYVGPLGEAGLAEYEIFWFGPWRDEDWLETNWLLFQRCLKYRPDAVFILPGWQPEHYGTDGLFYPRLTTLYLIRKLIGCKVMAGLVDLSPNSYSEVDHLARFTDAVFVYCQIHFRIHSSLPHKYVVSHVTFSPRIFHGDPDAERDIGLMYSGQIAGYADRITGLAALEREGLDVQSAGGRREDDDKTYVSSHEQYGDYCKRSRIIVNWSRHISGRWFQYKGRIFEATLSGALLLCEECEEVNTWFQPNVDYVPFSSPDDLVAKARYYLEHEDERRAIASQGHQTAIVNCAAAVEWGKRLTFLDADSRYSEDEAIIGLKLNATANELRVATYLRERTVGLSQVDAVAFENSIALLSSARRSPICKMRWESIQMRQIRDQFRRAASGGVLLGRQALRRVLPRFIHRRIFADALGALRGRKA